METPDAQAYYALKDHHFKDGTHYLRRTFKREKISTERRSATVRWVVCDVQTLMVVGGRGFFSSLFHTLKVQVR